MAQFLVILRPPRDLFLETITEREQQLAEEHYHYYKQLMGQKKLFMAGRSEDATMGIAIMKGENEKEVRKLVEADPSVMGGMFTYTIKEFRIALLDQE